MDIQVVKEILDIQAVKETVLMNGLESLPIIPLKAETES